MPDVIAAGDYVRGISDSYGITNKNMILGLVCKCESNNRIVVKSFLHEKGERYHSKFIVHKKDFALADLTNHKVKIFFEIVNNYMFDTFEECNKPISDVFSSDWNDMIASYEESEVYRCISSIGCGNSKQQVLSLLKGKHGINIYRK